MKLNMKNFFTVTVTPVIGAMLWLSTPGSSAPVLGAEASGKEPLILQLPVPTLRGTPEDLPKGPNIEPISDKTPAPFMVPKGVKNLALGKPVTASVQPFNGELSQITDGKKEPLDSDTVETKRGTQWVQVDLGGADSLFAIVLWHDHRYVQVVHDVIVQVSNDPAFKTGVQTLFNNDADNSSGQGVGTDREYFETNRGKIIDAKGMKARYVRAYTRGGTSGALNCWEEIEVYGLPAQ
jgi:hypothetical protein